MHFIGFGNVDFSAFHHFISSNKNTYTHKFGASDSYSRSSKAFHFLAPFRPFIIYTSVTVAPENIITGAPGYFLRKRQCYVLLCLAVTKNIGEVSGR